MKFDKPGLEVNMVQRNASLGPLGFEGAQHRQTLRPSVDGIRARAGGHHLRATRLCQKCQNIHQFDEPGLEVITK